MSSLDHLTYLELEVVADALDEAAQAIRSGFPDSPLPARGIRALLAPVSGAQETAAARRSVEWAAREVERRAHAARARARALAAKGR